MNKLPNSLPKTINELSIGSSLQIGVPNKIFINDICWNCSGTGKLKAMQSMAVIGGGSVRGPDTTIRCSFCKRERDCGINRRRSLCYM